MAIRLKQSTASQEIPLGFFLDDTDGKTQETGLTIANTDILLWKAGATTMASKNSGGATHMQNGLYYCTLDATDTNTVGALVIFVQVAGALPVRVECEVLPANVYDSLIAGSDNLQVDTTLVSGTAQTARDLGAGVVVTTNNDKTGYALSSAGIQAIWDALTSALTTAGSIGKLIVDNLNAAISSITPPSAASIADAVWDEPVAGHTSGTTAGGWLLSIPQNDDIANAVWDEDLAGHVVSGNAASVLNSASSNAFSAATNAADALTAATSIQSDVGDIQSRLPAALVSGKMDSHVGSLASGLLTIKKNTALADFEFLMVQSADHVSPATGLTVTAQRSIDGGLFAACANAVSEVGDGVYVIDLAASDLNGNVITFKFTASGADQRTLTILTQA